MNWKLAGWKTKPGVPKGTRYRGEIRPGPKKGHRRSKASCIRASLAAKARWARSGERKRMGKLLVGRTWTTGKNNPWRREDYVRNVFNGRKPIVISRPQMSMFKSLCRRGFRGVRLEHIVGRYPIDIAFPKCKLAIEVDGRHWHQKRKHLDARKDRFLKRRGWAVVRVPAESWRATSTWRLV